MGKRKIVPFLVPKFGETCCKSIEQWSPTPALKVVAFSEKNRTKLLIETYNERKTRLLKHLNLGFSEV